MSPLAPTRIKLIRPPHPRDVPPGELTDERVSEMSIELHRHARNGQLLRAARAKAHRASPEELTDALNALVALVEDNPRGTSARLIARRARAVARIADRITAQKRLKAFEQALVDEGLAEWIVPGDTRPLTAIDVIGVDTVPITHQLRIVGGRSLYEKAILADDSPNVRLMRTQASAHGPHQVSRYVAPDTRCELVRDGVVEPDPWAVLAS